MSSPMTSASDPGLGSDAMPSLTVGTTAPPSLSPLSPSRSPSLTPPPDEAAPGKRKAPPAGSSAPKAKKAKEATKDKKDAGEAQERGTYCHQCRRKCEPDGVLRCTKMKRYSKNVERVCNLAFCERDLSKRYGVDVDAVRKNGRDVPAAQRAGHDSSKPYVFACPCCLDQCQNSTCRKKQGLPLLGDIVKRAEEQGVKALDILAQPVSSPSKAAGTSTGDAIVLSDSELSDIEEIGETAAKPKKTPTKKAVKKPADKKATPKKDAKGKGKAVITTDAKTKKDSKEAKTKGMKDSKETGKGKGKAAVKDADKPKATPKPKKQERIIWPVVEPPEVTNTDSRMGREELEQRMYVREFVSCFRSLLGIPDRMLGSLDDFDHPLGESIVRQVAGSLLDLVIKDVEGVRGMDAMDMEELIDKREELRYGDLGKFASVFPFFEEVLDLDMPPDPAQAAKERNDKAMRALLDLDDGDAAPSWATEAGPSRRSGSRMPSPRDVVRMLVALIDHVISLEEVKFAMDPTVRNNHVIYQQDMSRSLKAEATRWDGVKKSLNAGRVRAKSADQSKAAKKKLEDAEYEHKMINWSHNQDYLTNIKRKQLRFEPIGRDLDGRVYYHLTERLIDDERYRPNDWSRGVLIYGRGFDELAEMDDTPTLVERWMRVVSAAGVKRLGEYVGYRWRSTSDDMKWEEHLRKEAEKETGAGGGEQNGSKTPGKTPIKPASVSKTPNSLANGTAPLSRINSVLDGVVLPLRKGGNDDDADSISDLSSVPDDDFAELLAQLDPPGYSPTADDIANTGVHLEMQLHQIHTFLSVLEWKGH